MTDSATIASPKRRKVRFDDLPLFATDAELAAALLGPARACEWRGVLPLYERRGFPKIDPTMGGRYTPAVKHFFDAEYGIAPIVPAQPDGTEDASPWTAKSRKRRGSAGASAGVVVPLSPSGTPRRKP